MVLSLGLGAPQWAIHHVSGGYELITSDRAKSAMVFNPCDISPVLFKKGGKVILVYWLGLRSNSAKEVKHHWPKVTEKNIK